MPRPKQFRVPGVGAVSSKPDSATRKAPRELGGGFAGWIFGAGEALPTAALLALVFLFLYAGFVAFNASDARIDGLLPTLEKLLLLLIGVVVGRKISRD